MDKDRYLVMDFGSDSHSTIVYFCQLTGKPIFVEMVEVDINADRK